MSVSDAFRFAAVIGHGPDASWWMTRIVMGVLGTTLVFAAFSPATGFRHGRQGPMAPIGKGGRAILFLMGAVMLMGAFRLVQ